MKVFVSYAREDEPYARKLSEALRRRGIDTSSDMAITAGASWATELRRMMDEADAFVLLASKSSAGSAWIDREVAAATARTLNDPNIRLIPVMLDRGAELSPLVSRFQYIGAQIARDPDRVADLIQESLTRVVSHPNVNLERVTVEVELAKLHLLAAQQAAASAKSWRALSRVTSIVGLVAGVVATILAAVSITAGSEAQTAIALVISVASTLTATGLTIYSARSRNDS
ncbi:toll/interleukin-1 receptor domain-containing protein [Nonomuraea cavernae]|uniref:TIR domain-containing protein n=1 Tax=Nonomuraea cavernae TaxID=2045107 RepID=A0A917YPG0_9ACTN|nr:toll/interleukin-1 receptor domain-containing protein [Nonomuraea cavernae]MCA2184661.1 toll/interleukin-1 receptor domain-containing protein [Nonomuraea cavernae]GGO63139.1 hypothetical protein GCM10012289_09370 [Nonomuraea cavernae]